MSRKESKSRKCDNTCNIKGPYTLVGLAFCHTHVAWVRECVVCREKFHFSRKDTLTCSDACRKSLSRTRQLILKVSQTEV